MKTYLFHELHQRIFILITIPLQKIKCGNTFRQVVIQWCPTPRPFTVVLIVLFAFLLVGQVLIGHAFSNIFISQLSQFFLACGLTDSVQPGLFFLARFTGQNGTGKQSRSVQ